MKVYCLECDANTSNSLSHVGVMGVQAFFRTHQTAHLLRAHADTCKLGINKILVDEYILNIFDFLYLMCTITIFQRTVNEITFSPNLFKNKDFQ